MPLVKAVQEAPHAPSGSSSSAEMPGQVATGPSMDAAAGQTTPISSTEAETEEDETIDIALDDHIFMLTLSACTTQPPQGSLKDCPKPPADLMGEVPAPVPLAGGTSSTTSTKTENASPSAGKN